MVENEKPQKHKIKFKSNNHDNDSVVHAILTKDTAKKVAFKI